MTDTQWIVSLIASFIGGGAVGSMITAIVTNYRNRRQPIGYTLDFFEIFKKDAVYGALQALITVSNASDSGIDLELENLSVARLGLINRGNQDIQEFKFGVTLQGSTEAIEVRTTTPDRYHIATCINPPSPPDFRHELDFILQPFNRGDLYTLNIYFTYFDAPGEIQLSSAHSTRFVEIGATMETANKVVRILTQAARFYPGSPRCGPRQRDGSRATTDLPTQQLIVIHRQCDSLAARSLGRMCRRRFRRAACQCYGGEQSAFDSR